MRVNPEVAELEKIRRWEEYILSKVICKNQDARVRNALLKQSIFQDRSRHFAESFSGLFLIAETLISVQF
jgi:hypothetical protein